MQGKERVRERQRIKKRERERERERERVRERERERERERKSIVTKFLSIPVLRLVVLHYLKIYGPRIF